MADTEYLREDRGGLIWGPLIQGELVKRYKRFLADVRLPDNQVVTAHCPNTGSMAGCSGPGWPVWLSRHDDPKRKLKYTWEITKAPDSLVGVNTSVPNRLVKAGVLSDKIETLTGYDRVKSEVKTGSHTRLDLMLEKDDTPSCYIEIKNCTLVENKVAMFPDAVTQRGAKHLEELARLVQEGKRGLIFFLVQRMDAKTFSPADRIDPEYGRLLRQVVSAGVEAEAYDVAITRERIDLANRVRIEL